MDEPDPLHWITTIDHAHLVKLLRPLYFLTVNKEDDQSNDAMKKFLLSIPYKYIVDSLEAEDCGTRLMQLMSDTVEISPEPTGSSIVEEIVELIQPTVNSIQTIVGKTIEQIADHLTPVKAICTGITVPLPPRSEREFKYKPPTSESNRLTNRLRHMVIPCAIYAPPGSHLHYLRHFSSVKINDTDHKWDEYSPYVITNSVKTLLKAKVSIAFVPSKKEYYRRTTKYKFKKYGDVIAVLNSLDDECHTIIRSDQMIDDYFESGKYICDHPILEKFHAWIVPRLMDRMAYVRGLLLLLIYLSQLQVPGYRR